jgi:hypothetical protein
MQISSRGLSKLCLALGTSQSSLSFADSTVQVDIKLFQFAFVSGSGTKPMIVVLHGSDCSSRYQFKFVDSIDHADIKSWSFKVVFGSGNKPMIVVLRGFERASIYQGVSLRICV